VLRSVKQNFAQHFDARAVDQQVQAACRRAAGNDDMQMCLPAAHGAVPQGFPAVIIGRWPVQSSQFEQTLHHAHGLSQGEVEQAFDCQAELKLVSRKEGRRPRLPQGAPCQGMYRSNQTISTPRALSAAL